MSTTINAVTFNLINLSIISTHRNRRTNQPGSDTNYITDLGYDGLTIRINGFETTLAVYDNVIAEFMSSGEQTLIVRDGWQFKVHSTQVSPNMLQSKPNYFPYSFTLITSTPYRESISEITRSKTITTNNQTWSADDSTNDITTNGNVNAVPSIKITSSTSEQILISQTSKMA